MFYSQSLLSKNGVLGTIWVAAHCLKRLKKQQVSLTNISSSVDKILADEVPVVAHRVLAFLLLGVVRIYSLKVDYLYDDCNRVVDRINDFSGIKKKSSSKIIEGFRAPRISLSISRPKVMELDAFDLQILDDSNHDKVGAVKDTVLEDACTSEGSRYLSPDKNRYDADGSHPEPFSTDHTPVKDVISPYSTVKDVATSSINLVLNSEASIEKLRANGFSLEDRLDPMVLGDTEEDPGSYGPTLNENENDTNEKRTTLSDMQNEVYLEEMIVPEMKSPESREHQGGKDVATSSINLVLNSEASIENLRANSFSLEDRLDPMVLGDAEEDPGSYGPTSNENVTNEKRTKLSDMQNEVYLEETIVPEMKSLESREHQGGKDRHVTMSVDVDFQSKDPPRDSEFVGVQTPVLRERGSSSRKRKCLFDEVVVLSNKMLKDSLNDTSSVVCSRTKAPHTPLGSWKRQKLFNPQIFSESLFSGGCSELQSLFSQTKLKSTGIVDDVEKADVPEKLNIPESPTWDKFPDEAYIALTPVTQSASLRSPDDVETVQSDRGGHTSTADRVDEELTSSEEEDSERCLINEELNSEGKVMQERDGWSDRTRLVARQLCKSFQSRKKQKQNKGVSLLQILKKKMKNESARFFYETLVLKTRRYIDVEQNEAYGDILVLETPKLKQACECGEFDANVR